MFNPSIYIVEDDLFYAHLLKNEINKKKLGKPEVYYSGESFLNHLFKKPDIVLLDYKLNSMNGLEVLNKIKIVSPTTSVILISDQDKASIVIKSLKNGAFGYLEKNNSTLIHLNTLINMLQTHTKN